MESTIRAMNRFGGKWSAGLLRSPRRRAVRKLRAGMLLRRMGGDRDQFTPSLLIIEPRPVLFIHLRFQIATFFDVRRRLDSQHRQSECLLGLIVETFQAPDARLLLFGEGSCVHGRNFGIHASCTRGSR